MYSRRFGKRVEDPYAHRLISGTAAQLKSQAVYAETPADFIDVLDDDFFWTGLSWFAIAKYVRVQVQLWLDNGWAVPSRLRRGLPERAMARHEETGGLTRVRLSLLLLLILLR